MSERVVGKRTFARNLLTNWVTLFVEVSIAFFITPFIVGSLGIATYGIWSIANNIVGYLGLADLGIRGSVGRYLNAYMARGQEKQVNEVVATSLMILGVMGLAATLVAWAIGANFYTIFPSAQIGKEFNLVYVLPVLGVALTIAFFRTVFRLVVIAHERFDLANLVDISALIFRAIGVIMVLLRGHGLLGLSIVLAMSHVVGTIGMLIVGRIVAPAIRPGLGDVSWVRLREMWTFGIANFVTRSARQVTENADELVVLWFFGPTAVGIYSIANMLIQYARRGIDQIGIAMFPSIMKAGGVANVNELQTMFLWKARLSLFIAVLVGSGLIVFGGDFIGLWVGPEMAAAAIVLSILATSELFSQFESCGSSILFGLGRVKFNVSASIAEAATNFGASIALVTLAGMGFEGVALGTLISVLIFRVGLYPWYTTKFIDFSVSRYFSATAWRAVLLALLAISIFSAEKRFLAIHSWPTFFALVLVGTSIYLPIGSALALGWRETFGVWRRIVRAAPAR